MRESNESALVTKPPGLLEKAEPGARRILSSMVADTLALAKPIFTVLMCDDDPTSNVAEVVIRSDWPHKYSIRFIRFTRDSALLKLTQEEFCPIFFVYVGNVKWSTSANDLFTLFTQATEVWRQIEAQHGLLIIATQGMNLGQLFQGTGIMERLAVRENTFLCRQCNIEKLRYGLKEVILQSWHRMGKQYFGGRGVPQDYAEAVKWFRKAAEQNYAQAQYALGICYDGGDGVTKDEFEAANWYRKAAEQNDAEGQFSLGVRYANGRGVEKDNAEAAKWFRKAAEQGHQPAQQSLGAFYANGRVAIDIVSGMEGAIDAYQYIRLAKEKGCEGAAKTMDVISALLSPEELCEAERRYQELCSRRHAS
jgi:TPR repeat protein